MNEKSKKVEKSLTFTGDDTLVGDWLVDTPKRSNIVNSKKIVNRERESSVNGCC